MASRVFLAQWPGLCGECYNPIRRDEEVRYNDDDLLVHADCEQLAVEESIEGPPPCPHCFLVHAGECL
jgi:hypothetical protein